MRSIPALAFAWFLASLPFASADNPWRELASPMRDALAPLLRPDPAYFATPFSNSSFRAWYKTHYCPSLADGASTCPAPGAPSPDSVYAEFAYNELPFDSRVSLACVMTRITEEGPLLPGIGTIKFAGDQGVLGFLPGEGGGAAVRSGLLARGYGDWHGASFGSNRRWGLRSPRAGAYLHWTEGSDGVINVHIDLNNPGSHVPVAGAGTPAYLAPDGGMGGGSRSEFDGVGDTGAVIAAGLRHRELDLEGRARTHTPLGIVAAFVPDACGIGASDLALVASSASGDLRATLLAIASTRCPP